MRTMWADDDILVARDAATLRRMCGGTMRLINEAGFIIDAVDDKCRVVSMRPAMARRGAQSVDIIKVLGTICKRGADNGA